jgi:hypothetical protein
VWQKLGVLARSTHRRKREETEPSGGKAVRCVFFISKIFSVEAGVENVVHNFNQFTIRANESPAARLERERGKEMNA